MLAISSTIASVSRGRTQSRRASSDGRSRSSSAVRSTHRRYRLCRGTQPGQVRADVGDAGLHLVGLVDAEAGEDVQRLLPVMGGAEVVAEGVAGMGHAVVGA